MLGEKIYSLRQMFPEALLKFIGERDVGTEGDEAPARSLWQSPVSSPGLCHAVFKEL